MAEYYKLLKEDGDYLLQENGDKILLEHLAFALIEEGVSTTDVTKIIIP